MSKKGAIILIEDDQDDQEVLREVFAELEVKNELRFFDNCEQAFTHLMSIKEKPFLIICDINLPKMNGIELKQKIDNTDYLRNKAIPFVFLTTSDSRQIINAAYRVTNLQGYFQKSQTMAEIRHKVKLILDYWREALHP
jgi:CheY-like chemotaxis protein